jgi:hypothetical protein
MAIVSLSEFQMLQQRSASVGHDEIAALAITPRATLATFGDRTVEIITWPVITVRKS